MAGEPRIRGKVNVVLNGLVRAGVIGGFSTTFGTGSGENLPIVTVTVPEGQSPEAVRARVTDALADVAIGIRVEARQP